MKILLDESVPQKLRLLLDRNDIVVTTAFQGWSGLKNGALLRLADAAEFDVFVTSDQEIVHQQNPAGRKIAMVVLSTNNWSLIRQNVDSISEAIRRSTEGTFVFLDLGHASD